MNTRHGPPHLVRLRSWSWPGQEHSCEVRSPTGLSRSRMLLNRRPAAGVAKAVYILWGRSGEVYPFAEAAEGAPVCADWIAGDKSGSSSRGHGSDRR